MRYKLQNLGIGGVLDQATNLVRDNFKQLYPIMLALHWPPAIVYGFAMQSMTPVAPINPTPEQSIQFSQQIFSWLPYFYIGQFIYLFLTSLTNSLMIAPISSHISANQLAWQRLFATAFLVLGHCLLYQ